MQIAGIADAPRHARGMYASLGAGIFELLWMSGRPREGLGAKVIFTDETRETLARAKALGRGVIVATAHTGNWDLVACAAAELGQLSVVTKRLSLGALDRFWQTSRAQRGIRLVSAEGASANVGEALREGGMVALLVDQVPERRGGFVELPFLGRPARCDLIPAMLAARHRAPLLLALGRRLEDGRHLVEAPLLFEPPTRPSRAWILEATGQLQETLEAFVRAHPSQWLWLHRRWKLVDAGPSQPASSSPSASLVSASSRPPSPGSLSSQTESLK